MGLLGILLGGEDLGFGPLQLRDVGIDRDGAAILGLLLVDLDPATVAAPLDVRSAGMAMPCQPLGNPLLLAAPGFLDGSALSGRADDRFIGRAGAGCRQTRIEQLAIGAVAEDQFVLGII